MNLCNRGRKEAGRRGGEGCRTHATESVRRSTAAAIGVQEQHRTLHVQARSREALPREKETSALWPRRGRRGLRQRCASSFDGGFWSRVPHVLGTPAAAALEFYSGPVRRGASNRTTRPRMSSMEDELKGGSNEIKAEGGMDSETLPEPGE